MDSAAVDFVIRGEGEVAMPLLAKAISEGSRYDDIPGLVFRNKDGTLQINPAARMQHLMTTPCRQPSLSIKNSTVAKTVRSTVIVASRGCPMKCSYCCFGDRSDLSYRQKSVDTVIREIETIRRPEHNPVSLTLRMKTCLWTAGGF